MIPFKDFDEEKLREYSIENLRSFINEIEMKKSVLIEELTTEMGQVASSDKFDIYSFFGKRKIKKISEKYAGKLTGADIYLEMIKAELARKEDQEEEDRYSGRSILKKKEMSEEEFLQKEQDKTWAYRSKIE